MRLSNGEVLPILELKFDIYWVGRNSDPFFVLTPAQRYDIIFIES
nr:MAG TPA: hypothetical protein [Caudoviricetes sp.]